MRKIIQFIIFAFSLWWYIYKSEDTYSKGLKRFMVSIKMASMMAFVLLGGPRDALGQSETEAFHAHALPQNPAILRKGFFGSSSAISSITPDDNNNDNGFGSLGNDNDLSFKAKAIKKNIEKPEKSIEYPYYRQPVPNQDDESEKQCSIEEIKVGVAKDGSFVNTSAS
jgi:hypothetical protein